MENEKSKIHFTFIDLFAGLGGFHLAMEKLGGKCVFACEIQEDLRELYTKNFGMECKGDMNAIDIASDIPKHDVLCAGFPCQPFSKAGKQQGFEDEKDRGNLFWKIKKILDEKHPEYILLENVQNLKTHDNGKCDILSACHLRIQKHKEMCFNRNRNTLFIETII